VKTQQFESGKPHPLTVLCSGLGLLISALFVHRPLGLSLLFILCFSAIIGFHIPARLLWQSIRRAWILLLITFVFHALLSSSEQGSSAHWLHIGIGLESLSHAALFTLRFVLIIVVGVVIFQIYTPLQYGREVGKLLSRIPFGRKSFAQLELMVAVALRFIPLLDTEYHRLKLALAARGVSAPMGVRNRLIQNRRIIMPLVVNAVRRGDLVAYALEARGFDSSIRRTSMKVRSWSGWDAGVIVLTLAMTIMAIQL
jgi:energy-coupling factor transport system ATP-binding protein